MFSFSPLTAPRCHFLGAVFILISCYCLNMELPWTVSTNLLAAALSIQSLFTSATPPKAYQRTELRSYVELFQTEAALHGNFKMVPLYLKVSFIQHEVLQNDADDSCGPPLRVAGYCFLSRFQSPIIAIDQDYWNRSSVEDRISLVFHELGHCLLYRLHADDTFRFKGERYPQSLMHSTLIMGSHFWMFFDSYMNEMFLAENPDPLIW